MSDMRIDWKRAIAATFQIPSSDGRLAPMRLLTFKKGWSTLILQFFKKHCQKRSIPLKEVFMFLFGPVGPTELLLIVLIIVIIFGARRLPELGKSLGEGIKNFKKSIGGKDEKPTPPTDESPPSKD